MRCLSIRQPWCDPILRGLKPLENRQAWPGCSYRGPLLLHASKGMTRDEYLDVQVWAQDAGVGWGPPPFESLVRGAIVGRCRLVGVVRRGVDGWLVSDGDPFAMRVLTPAERRWWMGGFALVLADVEELVKPIPYRGMLGLFEVPDLVLAGAEWRRAA